MAVVIIIRHHSHIRRGWRTGSEEGGARHAVQQTCVRLQETKGTGDTPDPGRCAGWTLRWLGTCVRLHEIKGAGDTPDPGRCAGWGRCAVRETEATRRRGSVRGVAWRDERRRKPAPSCTQRGVQAGTSWGLARAGRRVLAPRAGRRTRAARDSNGRAIDLWCCGGARALTSGLLGG